MNGEHSRNVSLSGLKPGMTFSYEPPILEEREACSERRRVLTLRYIYRSEAHGKRFVFDVIGTEDRDAIGWSSGHLFLDAVAVERSLKRSA